MARPKRQFTDEIVQRMEALALNGCQNGTIANILEIPNSTLIRRFGKLLTKKRCERKEYLRTVQTNLAAANPAMAIFLGKNELNQTDKQIVKNESTAPVLTDAERQALAEISRKYKVKLA